MPKLKSSSNHAQNLYFQRRDRLSQIAADNFGQAKSVFPLGELDVVEDATAQKRRGQVLFAIAGQ